MSDENEERSLLVDLLLLGVVVGLGLAAVYFTGNWEKMIKLIINLDKQFRPFISSLVESVKSVTGAINSIK